jgi:nitrate reductase molybdenum cofactor assembly chaperone NarJ/NarW
MGDYAILANALRYPAPGRARQLAGEVNRIQDEATRNQYAKFVGAVQKLSIGQWEELHTSTLDLTPTVAPYIGFQRWGDSYQRGVFMAALNRQVHEYAIDAEGELPDHLVPVLRYLDVSGPVEPALVEALNPALEKMVGGLRKLAPDNPYCFLLSAIQIRCQRINKDDAAQKPEELS